MRLISNWMDKLEELALQVSAGAATRGFVRKKVFRNFEKIHRKTPVPESS